MARATRTPKTAAKKTAAKSTGRATAKTSAAAGAATKKKTAKKAAKKAAAKSDELVHCYRLIFQVQPGGSRKAESFVAGTLAEAKKAALADLESEEGAYHALCYGEQIVLQCWEGPTKVASADLHPYITYRLADRREPIHLPGGDDPGLSGDDEELADALGEGEIEFKVKLDLSSLGLPALKGRPVRPGESVTLERGRVWKHGLHIHWDEHIPV